MKKTIFFLLTFNFLSTLYCPNPDAYDAYEANPQAHQASQITVDYFDLYNAARALNQQGFNGILNSRFSNVRDDRWTENRILSQLLQDHGTMPNVYQCIMAARIRLRRCNL